MEGLLKLIQSLSLDNRKWLSERLVESIEEEDGKYISKDNVLAGIDAGLKDYRNGMIEDAGNFLNEMRNESYG